MNTVALTGRLTQELALKKSAEKERSYCRFRIAVPKRSKKNEADFFTVTTWGVNAEYLVKYGAKGALVSVQGKLFVNKYQTQDGSNRETVEINAEAVEVLEYRDRAEQQAQDNIKAQAAEIAKQPDISQISTDDLEGMDLPFEF